MGGRRVTPDRRRRSTASRKAATDAGAAEAAAAAAAAASAAGPANPAAWIPPVGAAAAGLSDPEAASAEAAARTEASSEAHTPWLPMLDDRSPDPAICPFLRAVEAGPDGREQTVQPVESPDPANRCAALAEAVPQSLRQQELVCLTSGHVNCPRYLRGAVATPEPVVAAPRAGRNPSPAIIGSIAILVASFAASVAFVTARGGLAIDTAASARPSSSAVAEASAPPSVEPTIEVTPVPTPDVTAEPTPTPEPTAAPTPEPTPAPTPQPTPEPTPTPQPTSDRYQLLTACPDAADCWIYTIRAGDNLFSIANYFGVSLDAIYARNPWAESTPLRSGQQLRLPPPTR